MKPYERRSWSHCSANCRPWMEEAPWNSLIRRVVPEDGRHPDLQRRQLGVEAPLGPDRLVGVAVDRGVGGLDPDGHGVRPPLLEQRSPHLVEGLAGPELVGLLAR